MHISLFLPPPKKKKRKKKKCKRHPIYSINVYKCTTVQTNKSITTNLEQGLSNTTTRLFFSETNNLTLINCTYTTFILQFIWSKEAVTTSVTGELYSFWWPHRPPPIHLHTQRKKRKRFFKHPFLQLRLIYFTSNVQNWPNSRNKIIIIFWTALTFRRWGFPSLLQAPQPKKEQQFSHT